MYKTIANYNYTQYFAKTDTETKTEPEQAYSIREILYRFSIGNLPPLSVNDNYTEEDEPNNPSNTSYDLSDIPTRFEKQAFIPEYDTKQLDVTDITKQENVTKTKENVTSIQENVEENV